MKMVLKIAFVSSHLVENASRYAQAKLKPKVSGPQTSWRLFIFLWNHHGIGTKIDFGV
jgi:hypothetical protein